MARKTKTGAETSGDSSMPAGRPGSKSGFFRQYFRDNPGQLKKRGIKEALDQWLQANPGHTEVPKNIQQAAFNVKSVMKKKKRKRMKAEGDNGAASTAPRTPVKVLQSLEEQIDQCLFMARSVGSDALGDVVESLRQARNDVILKQGN
jgi:hypothetical protein